MAKYNVKFLQTALDDLDEIILYIARDSRQGAINVHDKIIKAANRLKEFPMSGRLVPDEKIGKRGFRIVVVGNYLLFYKVYDKQVVILRILHGKRDYPHLLVSFPDESNYEV